MKTKLPSFPRDANSIGFRLKGSHVWKVVFVLAHRRCVNDVTWVKEKGTIDAIPPVGNW